MVGASLALALAGTRQRVAVIERKWLGGTCVNTGCMPTKTLVASAYAAACSELIVSVAGISPPNIV